MQTDVRKLAPLYMASDASKHIKLKRERDF